MNITFLKTSILFILSFSIVISIFLKPALAINAIPVFPGAEGFGTETRAAYGNPGVDPVIFKVTTLNDGGAGSLRAAIEASEPRVIIFEVAGTINLTKGLRIKYPYVTIAGQTAPSPGITLAGDGIEISTHDVLIQHLRVRTGDRGGSTSPVDRGALEVASSTNEVYNIVIDHSSFSWATDENVSTWFSGLHDVTFNKNIISEGLNNSSHPKGAHSCGLLIGDYSKRIAVIGNLFAHNSFRNPATKGGTSEIILNNLIYNYWSGAIHYHNGDKSGPVLSTVVGNVIETGKDTPSWAWPIDIWDMESGTQIYLKDNQYNGQIPTDPWSIVQVGQSSITRVVSPPIWISPLTVRSSSEVKDNVLANAGARPWDRDAVDKRIVNDVKNKTGRIIDSQDQVGGWPNLPETHRALTLPNNPNGDDDQDGYTNLEEWLQQMDLSSPLPSCPLQSRGDINCDNSIGINDLLLLLNNWGSTTYAEGDLNSNGRIESGDLLTVLSNWGG